VSRPFRGGTSYRRTLASVRPGVMPLPKSAAVARNGGRHPFTRRHTTAHPVLSDEVGCINMLDFFQCCFERSMTRSAPRAGELRVCLPEPSRNTLTPEVFARRIASVPTPQERRQDECVRPCCGPSKSQHCVAVWTLRARSLILLRKRSKWASGRGSMRSRTELSVGTGFIV